MYILPTFVLSLNIKKWLFSVLFICNWEISFDVQILLYWVLFVINVVFLHQQRKTKYNKVYKYNYLKILTKKPTCLSDVLILLIQTSHSFVMGHFVL